MKPSPKELKVAAEIRHNIVSGRWPLGKKIQPYAKLEKVFPVSRVTLHRAISRLQREGFINGYERKGIYVSENPPHLKRVAVILATPEDRNRFSAILANDARNVASGMGFKLEIYEHIDRPFYDIEEAEKFKEELSSNRFAGMIVSIDPDGCPLRRLFDFRIPKVYLSPGSRKDGSVVALDNMALTNRALRWLRDNGARRISVLGYPSSGNNPFLEHSRKLIDKYGFETKPEWLLEIGKEEMSDYIARLIFAAEKGKRPDGLFIADDNLTEHVARGIVAAGIRVPEDLKVISHCNWSMLPKCQLPVKFIGFDSRRIISEGLRIIEEGISGKNAGTSVNLPPILEGEDSRK